MYPIIIFKEPEKKYRKNIIQMKTRILRPVEYKKLRFNFDKSDKTFFYGLLLSGMKLDRKLIKLPEIRSKKRILIRQRSVKLSSTRITIIKNLQYSLDTNLVPDNQSYIKYLKRLAMKLNMDIEGLNLKCFRKTCESWLIASYPYRMEKVFLNKGHTTPATIKDYNNLPFRRDDMLEMKELVKG